MWVFLLSSWWFAAGTLAGTEFDNSVLLIPPWPIGQCADLSKKCAPDNKNFTKECGEMCDDTGNCTVRVAIILPQNSDYIVNIDEAKTRLESAVEYGRSQNWLPESTIFKYITFDDKCTQSQATVEIVHTLQACPHVIFGPTCEHCLSSVARVLQYYGYGGIPLFTPTGFTFDFTIKKTDIYEDDMYMLINSGLTDFRSYGEFMHMMMVRYNWTKFVLMYHRSKMNQLLGENSCKLFMESVIEEIKQIKVNNVGLDFVDGDLELLGVTNYTDFLVTRVGIKYAIVFLCTNYESMREIVLAAQQLKMFEQGEYFFFNFELYNGAQDSDEPWIVENDTRNGLAHDAFKSVYTFTPYLDMDKLKKEKERIYLDGISDGMFIYMQALNKTLDRSSEEEFRPNQTPLGCQLVYNIMGQTFDGDNESIVMNCNAQRVNKFALMTVNSSGQYDLVGSYWTLNKTIDFWEVEWPHGDPLDTPTCGYDLSKCPTYNPINVLVICLATAVVLGVSIIAFILFRHFKLKAEIYSMAWKINYADILPLPNKPRRNSTSTLGSVRTDLDGFSVAGERQLFTNVGYYNSIRVAIKRLKDGKVDLNRQKLVELKVLTDLSNDNLTKFFGACLDGGPNCILTEYCPRGSLQDILENDDVKLDWPFRMSLIMDLVRGMLYLHNSEIKSHGALKSSNCLVDSRFVLKITDFGLHFLREFFQYDEDFYDPESHIYWERQLWTAPELLRQQPFPAGGTQKGDIYSFAIIMHEITTRHGVFYLGDDYFKSPKEIVETVRKGPEANNGQPLRPEIGVVEDEVAQLMNKCWAEDTADRPDFSTLKTKLRHLNKESDGNLLDNLLARMEQYANNLETLVEERTADYLEEKQKCELLLYQLLPKSVARQLITGESVIAETFDSVTIYFSDIVGFTALSAQSTPLQVVELLNDLYTCFDSIIENFDVYKVETIGDAYMVVSGLPCRNGNKHAGEIARMSLALLKNVKKFQIRHRPDQPLQLRIGIHTGPCVAGVVGLKMPRYCLFGDTVNTASRMESNGHPLKIHVSPVTKAVLDTFGTFDLTCRGEVEMKGKGKMTTYWLNGERNTESKPKSPAKLPNTPIPTKRSNPDLANPSYGPALNSPYLLNHRSEDAEVPLLSITSPDFSQSHA